MKLVRIDEDMFLDINDAQFAVWRTARENVLIGFKSNNNSVTTGDKKVLDTICGSEEHSVIYAGTKISNAKDIDTTKESYFTN